MLEIEAGCVSAKFQGHIVLCMLDTCLLPQVSESVTGCHGNFLISQDLSKQMCLCLGGFSRSVMRNPKVDPD